MRVVWARGASEGSGIWVMTHTAPARAVNPSSPKRNHTRRYRHKTPALRLRRRCGGRAWGPRGRPWGDRGGPGGRGGRGGRAWGDRGGSGEGAKPRRGGATGGPGARSARGCGGDSGIPSDGRTVTDDIPNGRLRRTTGGSLATPPRPAPERRGRNGQGRRGRGA